MASSSKDPKKTGESENVGGRRMYAKTFWLLRAVSQVAADRGAEMRSIVKSDMADVLEQLRGGSSCPRQACCGDGPCLDEATKLAAFSTSYQKLLETGCRTGVVKMPQKIVQLVGNFVPVQVPKRRTQRRGRRRDEDYVEEEGSGGGVSSGDARDRGGDDVVARRGERSGGGDLTVSGLQGVKRFTDKITELEERHRGDDDEDDVDEEGCVGDVIRSTSPRSDSSSNTSSIAQFIARSPMLRLRGRGRGVQNKRGRGSVSGEGEV
ncbi:hypothetical protein GPALN_015641 [Globodera pallida]|nr:hypothetical protein GPALN_015641 [Globodera pallida]